MPLMTLHLLDLAAGSTREDVVSQLKKTDELELVVASRPRHWVVRPEKKDVAVLTSNNWDLMVLIKSPAGELPLKVKSQTVNEYKVAVGVPSKLLALSLIHI